MSDDVFGFSQASNSTVDKLKGIKPSPKAPEPAAEVVARADSAGEKLGFQSREQGTAQIARRHRRELGPTTTINTRAPQWVAGPFIAFCDEHRYSYWEGIEALMIRAGLISEAE